MFFFTFKGEKRYKKFQIMTRFSSAFGNNSNRSAEVICGDNGYSIMKTPVSGFNELDVTTLDQLENVDGENLNGSDKVLENIETETPVARDLATCCKDVSDTSVVVSDYMHTPGPHLNSSTVNSGKELEQPSSATAMEFNPIKQHRHFCPWIASSGKAPPGWKQTLTALGRLKEFAYPSDTTQVSSSLIEVEDPVGSVEKLLTPPSAKRKKFTHGSI